MANKVFRQSLCAGVALAGASAIALTPVTVVPGMQAALETPRAVSTHVMPTGLVQDLQLVASGAQAALGQSYDALTRKIPDMWWTVHANWPDADILHWNYALLSDMVLAPITPLVIGPFNDAVAEAVARNFPILGDQIRQIPDFIEYAFIRIVGPILSAIGGAGVAHSEIFYSMTTLRIEPFIKAIVRAPLNVLDGLLFGGYGDLGPILPGREGEYIPAPGLLTPWGQAPAVRDIKTPDEIVDTSVADINATLVSLVTETAETAEVAEVSLEAEAPVTEPVVTEVVPEVVDETVVPEVVTEPAETAPVVEETDTVNEESTEDTAAEAVTEDESSDDEAEAAKPAERDPAVGIRQGIKDFRAGVRNTVRKLTGAAAPARSESSESDSATTSDSTDAE